jgi:hypothetical protein
MGSVTFGSTVCLDWYGWKVVAFGLTICPADVAKASNPVINISNNYRYLYCLRLRLTELIGFQRTKTDLFDVSKQLIRYDNSKSNTSRHKIPDKQIMPQSPDARLHKRSR